MTPQILNTTAKTSLQPLPENSSENLTDDSTETTAFTDLSTLTISDIQDWLAVQIADQLGISTDYIENNIPFHTYGLNSVQAMAIATAGKKRFGLEISPLVIWNCPTIDTLSTHIIQALNSDDTETFEL